MQIEQRLESGIVEALCRKHRSHVIDDIIGRQRAQGRRKFADRPRLEIDVDMPAQFGHAVNDAIELVDIADTAETLEEGEAAAANAGLI